MTKTMDLRLQDEFYRETEKIVKACVDVGSTGHTDEQLTEKQRHILRMVKDSIAERPDYFRNTCKMLKLTSSNFYSNLLIVWKNFFTDDEINWGRITALLAFCQYICYYAQEIGLATPTDSVPPWAATFICVHLRDWITSQGGWDAFPRVRSTSITSSKASVGGGATGGGWLEQTFRGLALSFTILESIDSLRVR